MGAGLLDVKSGFILFNRIYQLFNNKLAERERERQGFRDQVLVFGLR